MDDKEPDVNKQHANVNRDNFFMAGFYGSAKQSKGVVEIRKHQALHAGDLLALAACS